MKTLLLKIIDWLNLYPVFNRFTRNTATIFMLHRFVGDSEIIEDFTSQKILDEFLEYLNKNDYKVISLSEYIKFLIDGKQTYKTVIFTVDDGYRDFYDYAYPVFKKYNYPASIFITGDFIEGKLFFWWDAIEYVVRNSRKKRLGLDIPAIERDEIESDSEKAEMIDRITHYCKSLKNDEKLELITELSAELQVEIPKVPPKEYAPLSWDQIEEMGENRIEFMPHTMTHPILSKVPREQQNEEIGNSRKLLQDRLNRACDIFCYPNGGEGDFSDETIEILKNQGFTAAVTGLSGFDFTDRTNDMFRLKRFSIPENAIDFKQYVSGLEIIKWKLR